MCKFCETMQRHERTDAILKQHDPDMEHRYSVAIITRIFLKGQKGCRGTAVDYRYRGCGYELNFCPECGRKLTKNSAIDDPTERQ